MTKGKINIAIAEACGFIVEVRETVLEGGIQRELLVWYKGTNEFFQSMKVDHPEESLSSHRIPNFCNDLNAMHEAECNPQVMLKCVGDYEAELEKITRAAGLRIWAAKANHRAEAMARALGKWKD